MLASSRISLLIVVGSSLFLLVLTEALSASSSIISIGISILPVASAFNAFNQSRSFINTFFCFFITKTTAVLSERATAILSELPVKSPFREVNDIEYMGLLSLPTPTRFPPVLPAAISIPINPSSTRSCVCFLNDSIVPVRSINTLYPASAALHINPI